VNDTPDPFRAASPPGPSGGRKPSRLDDELAGLRRAAPRAEARPSPRSGVPFMGIFSRTRDIVAANFNDMLDKADDPAKMIRMIILEMEETLVEVRASAARTIADQKEMHRHTLKLDQLQADWGEKAQLALSKDREDLARAALVERKKASDMAEQLKLQIGVLDDALRAYEQDIDKLQQRLREARSRQTAIAARLESAENRVKLRSLLASERVDEAMARFDQLERRVDYAEGRADALSLADGTAAPTLAEQISALAGSDTIDAELEQMKRALQQDTAGRTPHAKDA
jgi:phage shock protein A